LQYSDASAAAADSLSLELHTYIENHYRIHIHSYIHVLTDVIEELYRHLHSVAAADEGRTHCGVKEVPSAARDIIRWHPISSIKGSIKSIACFAMRHIMHKNL